MVRIVSFLRSEITHLWKVWSAYNPERHYMRGPGPKWREKQASLRIADGASHQCGSTARTQLSHRADSARRQKRSRKPRSAPSVIAPVESDAAAKLPQRPDRNILSEAIPLFFIGQNRDGFWVARDADGRVGGIFLLKQSALKFADKNAPPVGCAKMFLSGRFELDIENKGNPLVARLGAAKRVLTRLAPTLTAFIRTVTRQD